MFATIVQRMTAPFRRKRCPECGHKLRETYCDVCGYDLIEQTRDKLLRYRGPTGIRLELRSARPAGLPLQAASGRLRPTTQRNWVAARLGVTLRDQ